MNHELINLITYKAIAFGFASVLIGNDDSFKDLTILLKVVFKGILRSLPS